MKAERITSIYLIICLRNNQPNITPADNRAHSQPFIDAHRKYAPICDSDCFIVRRRFVLCTS